MSTDAELVEAAKRGEATAFAELMNRHIRAVIGICYGYMKDHGRAEDMAQEAFIKAHRSLADFRGDSGFKGWVVRIAINTCMNNTRSMKDQPHEDFNSIQQVSLESNQETLLTDKAISENLKTAIGKLPERQRLILEMKVLEDMDFKEIAESLGSPYDTVKANYRHAVINLRKLLAEDVEEL